MSRFTRMLTEGQKENLADYPDVGVRCQTAAIAVTTLRNWGEKLEARKKLPGKTLKGTVEEEKLIELSFQLRGAADWLGMHLKHYVDTPGVDRNVLIFARESADLLTCACERAAARLAKRWPHGATYLSERHLFPVIKEDTPAK